MRFYCTRECPVTTTYHETLDVHNGLMTRPRHLYFLTYDIVIAIMQ